MIPVDLALPPTTLPNPLDIQPDANTPYALFGVLGLVFVIMTALVAAAVVVAVVMIAKNLKRRSNNGSA